MQEPEDWDEMPQEVANRVNDLINEMIVDEEYPVRVADMLGIAQVVITRLRGVMSLSDVAAYMGVTLQMVEDRVQNGTAIINVDTGEFVNMVLGEEIQFVEADDLTVPDTVPEGWLDAD